MENQEFRLCVSMCHLSEPLFAELHLNSALSSSSGQMIRVAISLFCSKEVFSHS
jgi:hypothetical protein